MASLTCAKDDKLLISSSSYAWLWDLKASRIDISMHFWKGDLTHFSSQIGNPFSFLMSRISCSNENVAFTTSGWSTLSERTRMVEGLILEGNCLRTHSVFSTNSLSFGCHSFSVSFSSSKKTSPVLATAVVVAATRMNKKGKRLTRLPYLGFNSISQLDNT